MTLLSPSNPDIPVAIPALVAVHANARETAADWPLDPQGETPAQHENWLRWREARLCASERARELVVIEIEDPLQLRVQERRALLTACARVNHVVYRWRPADDEATERERLRAFAAQLGLHHLDGNWLADADGISSLRDAHGGGTDYIPYTNRAIRWHTDGYYNAPDAPVRAVILHCCRPAHEGGSNRLFDHELAYLLLRDEAPELVTALCHPQAMTIPPRDDESDPGLCVRPARTGPVFSRRPGGGPIHMRYTARTRSIAWRDDETTRAALESLTRLLDAGGPDQHRVRLDAGTGLLCNNVLHDRSGFTDRAGQSRLMLRARFHDPVAPCD